MGNEIKILINQQKWVFTYHLQTPESTQSRARETKSSSVLQPCKVGDSTWKTLTSLRPLLTPMLRYSLSSMDMAVLRSLNSAASTSGQSSRITPITKVAATKKRL